MSIKKVVKYIHENFLLTKQDIYIDLFAIETTRI